MASPSSNTSPPPSDPATTTTTNPSEISILFVCLGNICRSPMAEGVFHSLLFTSNPPSTTNPTTTPEPTFKKIDSAGTLAYHAGSPPDPRTSSVLAKHGITSYTHISRKVTYDDFYEFDYIFAMDLENLQDLSEMRNAASKRVKGRLRGKIGKGGVDNGAKGEGEEGLAKVMLYGAFGGKSEEEEVVDPYYGSGKGFEIAYEQVTRFGKGFLRYLEENARKDKD